VVICCLGLDAGLEGEEGDQGNQFASGDKQSLSLPGNQESVLKACIESGKPVVVVLSGSALALGTAQEGAAAVLQAWYPGAQGGRAIARALFGECNPQGKLPVTFYHSDEDLPAFTDYAMKGRTYRYMEKEPLYPFGYGLSYSHFTFRDAKADAAQIGPDGVDVRVTVVNDGQYRGRETVEVYVKAERPGTPNAQLKALGKVDLMPGEEKCITLHLPQCAFALCNEEGISEVLPGEYTVWLGGSQPDARSILLTGQKPLNILLHQKEKVVISD
jgi:beta-glucosidase